MRADMSKVIVERPRRGGYEAKGRRSANRLHRDPDEIDVPTKAPLRDRDRRTKNLNENLQPLVRYLHRQVGRPWDKVRSEMGEHITLSSAVQKHILDHVKQYVEYHVVLINGVPCTLASYKKGYQPIAKHSFTKLYVCPKSGLLKRAKPLRERPLALLQVKSIDRTHAAVYLRGCWHEVTLESAISDPSTPELRGLGPRQTTTNLWDVVLGQVWSTLQLDAVWGKAQGCSRYAASVRPMTRAEIKMLPG